LRCVRPVTMTFYTKASVKKISPAKFYNFSKRDEKATANNC
jgi:hypothetical protein